MNVTAHLPWSRADARRGLLILAVVAMVVSSAGCTGILTDSTDADPQVEKVPSDANAIATLDTALLSDTETRSLLEGLNGTEAGDIREMGDVYAEFENESGLDLADVRGLTLFGTSAADRSSADEVGFLLDADWDAETVVESIADEDDVEYGLTEHAGEDVLWEPADPDQHDDPLYVGVHEDGQLVLGDRASVIGSLDVSYAGADPLSGDLVEAFENTRDGHVSFATDSTDAGSTGLPDAAAGSQSGPGEFGATGMEESLETLSGTYYTEDGRIGLEARLAFADADQAENVAEIANMSRAGYRSDLEPEQQQLLTELELETQGSSLILTWEDSVDALTAAANET